jgi:hypothetical protein
MKLWNWEYELKWGDASRYAYTNQMVIGRIIFLYKRMHKASKISQDITTENQIYHVCINKKK